MSCVTLHLSLHNIKPRKHYKIKPCLKWHKILLFLLFDLNMHASPYFEIFTSTPVFPYCGKWRIILFYSTIVWPLFFDFKCREQRKPLHQLIGRICFMLRSQFTLIPFPNYKSDLSLTRQMLRWTVYDFRNNYLALITSSIYKSTCKIFVIIICREIFSSLSVSIFFFSKNIHDRWNVTTIISLVSNLHAMLQTYI